MVNKILIADDDAGIRELVSVHLGLWGFMSIQAQNGLEVLEITRVELPDLILLDVMMPYKNGFQVACELLNDTATAHIPIIFFTARPEVRDLAEELTMLGISCITKPFAPDDLLSAIQEGLERNDLAPLAPRRLEMVHKLISSS